ncbi:hypothetical protein BGW37DRAFT_477979 [Umbelopsis sp. PMI_123]|nr:hypothetical protein BGW37DRAFT_477979 [Umbelopsis sp. PMI_123]
MNPFQELQQRANMKQAAGGVPPHEEAQLWQDKLIGKTLIENDQATDLSDDQTFLVKNLPQPFRVVKRDSMVTMDFRPERMNVHIDDNNKVTGVYFS